MSANRTAWTEEERRQNSQNFSGMVDVLNSLIVTINNQSERHSSEIEKIALKLEENTEVVRQCMTDLVKFNAERSNMIKACMELREDLKENTVKINELKNENVKLNERWNSLRISIATGFTICGLVIAVVKMV
jgi:chromosome segregation ATPase